MRIGIVGLGKLGLPVAVAIASRGEDVMGFDLDKSRMTHDPQPYRETGPDGVSDFNQHLRESKVRFGTLQEVIRHAEILFVAVQTPHHPMFEGTTPLPDGRRDFDYTYLSRACRDIGSYARDMGAKPLVVVISTCLPGAIRREVLPHLHGLPFAYNPFFIAMGTTMRDFLNPEFVLCGADDENAAALLREFYGRVLGLNIVNRFARMGIESAELAKVCYNTFISMKIAFANTVMEMCHRIPGADVDDITSTLRLGTERLISGRYLDGGMGDGGGCHPRDNIAMSWLARKVGLRYDFFEALMRQRQEGTEFLADLMCEHDLPKAIIGYSFKAGTNITVGSPALLLKSILEGRGYDVKCWDPYIDPPEPEWMRRPHVFLIGAKHPEFWKLGLNLPAGSVVIDPWRFVEPRHGLHTSNGSLVPVGVGPALFGPVVKAEGHEPTQRVDIHGRP